TQAIRLKPDDAFAFNNRGSAYGAKGDYDRAIADFTQAIRLKPDYAFAFYDRGLAYEHKGDYDRAIADYTEAIRLKPDAEQAFGNRGSAYLAKRDYDHAIADCNEAIRINPRNPISFNIRGKAYDNKGDQDRAIADYTEAIRLKPDYALAFFNRGHAYDHKGDYDRAVADYSEVIRLKPDDADGYNAEAWLLATCPDAKFRDGPQAVQVALKLVKLADDWSNRDTLAAAYAEAGQFADAVREEQKALKMLGPSGAKGDIADCQTRLALYQQNKPYHEPPKGAGNAASLKDKLDHAVAFGHMARDAMPAFAPSERLAPKQAMPTLGAKPNSAKPSSHDDNSAPAWPDPVTGQ
ncbi:MAG: tetratricopeptide repeat protein, partial [Alphaproteobacteria bacterium]